MRMMQAMAQAAGHGKSQYADELNALAEEAEMPILQLMAQCGYVVPNDGALQMSANGAEEEAEMKLAAAGGEAADAGEFARGGVALSCTGLRCDPFANCVSQGSGHLG